MSNLSYITRASQLCRMFTPTYVSRINAQIVHRAILTVVKPNELRSALMRPLHTTFYEPMTLPTRLAATLAYGLIQGAI